MSGVISRWGERPREPLQPKPSAGSRGRSPHHPEIFIPVTDYDLGGTLDSGQVFRWELCNGVWSGVLGKHFLQLTQTPRGIHARAFSKVDDWKFLREFLQSDVQLAAILKTFPDDEPMRRAVAACHGLRLLRQDPWECLASFILSSTKQIVQIRQIVSLLCQRFGEPIGEFGLRWQSEAATALSPAVKLSKSGVALRLPPQSKIVPHSFPSPERLAMCSEAELRECKMGFRAPSLLNAARQIAEGKLDLAKLRALDCAGAKNELMALRGVGPKIADCVLLFAYGFDTAFPVDVWVARALQELYFPKRRAGERRLRRFADTHFGSHAGYAQQYLFHYLRMKLNP
jgi:N-glycosylase/DNA lyase